MIKLLCYELYKNDWKKRHHITPEKEAEEIRNYYYEIINNDMGYSYTEYLHENGYDGTIYASYKEFMEEEYLCRPYMEALLQDAPFVKLYHDDIGCAWERIIGVIKTHINNTTVFVCGYKTDDVDEDGVVIAEIDTTSGSVLYHADEAKTDKIAQQKIKQLLESYGFSEVNSARCNAANTSLSDDGVLTVEDGAAKVEIDKIEQQQVRQILESLGIKTIRRNNL